MDKKNKELDFEKLEGISALFIHVAKIDDNYTDKEKNMILVFLRSFSNNEENIQKIFKRAENLENNSNQLLNFTNIIKKSSLESKSIIVKEIWKIILSDSVSDEYETNLIRRICGLIYFPDKLSGEIKMQLINSKK
tara:strand:+ start:4046 stop:4453 length:408 start_codon:yes stop_codon:yes gene_type:complete